MKLQNNSIFSYALPVAGSLRTMIRTWDFLAFSEARGKPPARYTSFFSTMAKDVSKICGMLE